MKIWWSQAGSNRRPPACHAGALPAELWPHSVEARIVDIPHVAGKLFLSNDEQCKCCRATRTCDCLAGVLLETQLIEGQENHAIQYFA